MSNLVPGNCKMCRKPVFGRDRANAHYCFDCLQLRCTPGYRARDPRREELAFLRRVHALVNEHAQWLLNEAEA